MYRKLAFSIPLLAVLACAPATRTSSGSEPDAIAAAAGSADRIFRARIVWYGVSPDSRLNFRPYGIRVSRVWKGPVADTVIVQRETAGTCPPKPPELFGEYIFYARHEPGRLYLDLCSRLVPVRGDSARADLRFLNETFRPR